MLWIAYGSAILSTALAVCVGMTALLYNGASWNNNFSTIVRVTRIAEMSVEVMDEDDDGRAPLPKYLANARFILGHQSENTNLLVTTVRKR